MPNLTDGIVRFFYNLGFFARTVMGVKHFIKRWNVSSKVLVMQILFTFVQAMGISCLLAMAIGAAVNIIGFPFVEMLGQQDLIYSILIIIITRELGPLLTSIIVIARSATAIATEMAGMVINHEVEAYISVGVDPIEHLAVPRFLGVTISVFLLNLYFSIFGLAGSFLVAQIFHSIPAGSYFPSLLSNLSVMDIVISSVKGIGCGMIISIVAVTEGLRVERASTEVPVAGLRAVSNAFASCIIMNVAVSAIYYMALA